jgi:hypothetical protein
VGERLARVEEQIKAIKDAAAAALTTTQKAIDKAEVATEKRFEGVNEFRATLSDQARLLMPRLEAEQQFRSFSEKIDVLTARVNARDDRGAGGAQVWIWVVAAAGLVGTVYGFFR